MRCACCIYTSALLYRYAKGDVSADDRRLFSALRVLYYIGTAVFAFLNCFAAREFLTSLEINSMWFCCCCCSRVHVIRVDVYTAVFLLCYSSSYYARWF